MRGVSGILLFSAAAALGCGPGDRVALAGRDGADAVHGSAQLERVEGDATLVTVVLEQLPRPQALSEDRTAYVLWIEDEAGVHNGGPLDYDGARETGRAMATSPSPRFVVSVTAEAQSTVTEPGDLVVVRRTIDIGK